MKEEIDVKRAQEFARHVFGLYTAGILSLMVHVGYKTGLLEAAAGLGTMWGEKVARRMLGEAGFTKVEVVDSPRP